MATAEELLADPELLASAWDLDPLVDGAGDDGRRARCSTRPLERAPAFAERHAGKVAELDADGLREAMHELAAIYELVGRAGSYAMLRFATDTADPARGALLQRVQERGTAIETKLLFFELEWAALDDEQAEAAARAATASTSARHYLRSARRYRPAPADRARGEDPRREVGHRPQRAGRGCSAS